MKARIMILTYGRDDPSKCTAEKLIRLGLAERVREREIPRNAIVLDPYALQYLTPCDRDNVVNYGIVAIDVSWKANLHELKVLSRRLRGLKRVLPLLIATNPVNFGKPFKLSTAEAIAAALYIVGLKDQAEEVLNVFKWGKTFFEVNGRLLDRYSSTCRFEDIEAIEREFVGIDQEISMLKLIREKLLGMA